MVWSEVREVTLTVGGGEEAEVAAGARPSLPPAPWEARTQLYAWGYAPPERLRVDSVLEVGGYGKPMRIRHRNQFAASEEARQIAQEQGWDQTRAGAWAAVIALPLDQAAAQALLVPALRQDPAVAGWAVQRGEPEGLEGKLGVLI
jgi:hypothetical protein